MVDKFKLNGDLGLPSEILELLDILHGAWFFEDGLLIGSWAILFYQELLRFKYVLRTGDIDFALIPTVLKETRAFDLDAEFVALGMEPIIDRDSGLQKFLTDLYEVEFLIHRAGGRDGVKLVRKYNVNAQAMPFLDILFIRPIEVELAGRKIKVPRPEALFFHKLIIAQRRSKDSKREKDLEQCGLLADHLDLDCLKEIVRGYPMSKKTLGMVKTSCEAINFNLDFLK